MPTRAVSMNDAIYVDIHKEMESTDSSFSQVVVRRLNELAELKKVKNE